MHPHSVEYFIFLWVNQSIVTLVDHGDYDGEGTCCTSRLVATRSSSPSPSSSSCPGWSRSSTLKIQDDRGGWWGAEGGGAYATKNEVTWKRWDSTVSLQEVHNIGGTERPVECQAGSLNIAGNLNISHHLTETSYFGETGFLSKCPLNSYFVLVLVSPVDGHSNQPLHLSTSLSVIVVVLSRLWVKLIFRLQAFSLSPSSIL